MKTIIIKPRNDLPKGHLSDIKIKLEEWLHCEFFPYMFEVIEKEDKYKKMKELGFEKEYYCYNCDCSDCKHKKRILQSIK